MRNYLTLFLTFCQFFFLSAQNVTTLHIDPENARGGTVSEVFDSIRFIPLETTKESLFGSIDQLEVTDSFFIILDVRSHSILLFRRNGQFCRKITTGGANKYFYSFVLDREAQEIVVSNNYANALLTFDYNGHFLRKLTYPGRIGEMVRFPGNIVLYTNLRSAQVQPSDHILYDLTYSKGYDSVIKTVKPYNAKYEDGEYNVLGTRLNPSEQDSTCLFSTPFENVIYQLNDTGVLRKYQFIFPLTYSLPRDFATDIGYAGRRAKIAYADAGYRSTITSLDKYFLYNEYLLFSPFSRRITEGPIDYNYAYNLQTGRLLSFFRVTPDRSSYYIPLLASISEEVHTIHKGVLYSSISSVEMLSLKNSLDKKVDYPPVLNAYFGHANRLDNAVLIAFKLKSGL
jgi:hypothetical protein